MFGKTKETSDIDEQTELGIAVDDFFGDETAVAEALRVDHLHERVTSVEQQISSQFTSLAAYAQIAQEQVELVRSEAQHTNERSEERVIGLIERERADRLASGPGGGIDVNERLDALDAQVGEIREGLRQCLLNQEALADAITELFSPADDVSEAPAAAPVEAAAVPAAPPVFEAAPAFEAAPVVEAAAALEAPAVVEPQPALLTEAPAPEPAPLLEAPSVPMTSETLPPPAAAALSLEELDHELEELGVDVPTETEYNEPVYTEPKVQAPAPLYGGPIAGLSLA